MNKKSGGLDHQIHRSNGIRQEFNETFKRIEADRYLLRAISVPRKLDDQEEPLNVLAYIFDNLGSFSDEEKRCLKQELDLAFKNLKMFCSKRKFLNKDAFIKGAANP